MNGPEHRWRKRLDARASRRRQKPKKPPRNLLAEQAQLQLSIEQIQAQHLAEAMRPAKSGAMPVSLLHGVLGRLF